MYLKSALAVAVWLMASSPAFAQVERVIVETEDLSTACAGGLDQALKLTDSVYKYAISIPKQMFSVIYYKGERFDPKRLKWAADQGEAYVAKFHVSATGKIEQDGDKRVFVAGEDRFALDGAEGAPVGVTLGIIGVVDDTTQPWTLKPDDVQLVPDDAEPQDQTPSAPAK